MVTGRHTRRSPDDLPPDDTTAFLTLLNELKATGCNLLVVGDAPREAFTRASAQLFGDADVLRHRVLAVTDATPGIVADRLPDPGEAPRPIAETTRLVTHAGVPRSAAADAELPPELADVRETRIADPELRGLEAALVDAIDDAADAAEHLSAADLRVGVDSLAPLLDHYGVDVVRRCLEGVGERVRDYRAMAHYVLPVARDADPVRALASQADAVIELRAVEPADRDRNAQQRWHVPARDITTEWTPL
ncbi:MULTISPECIES: hypothetical protein [Halorussus]|uniref:DUF7504 family protein n=1 Tax=Halorussus TaxID=1070314 RepID=UPI000E218D19|nr:MULTISPECIES: hypothetical protein [Halorussus]NHN61504.1 hypothetical protein [Halorussus sp. JP-T4]